MGVGLVMGNITFSFWVYDSDKMLLGAVEGTLIERCTLVGCSETYRYLSDMSHSVSKVRCEVPIYRYDSTTGQVILANRGKRVDVKDIDEGIIIVLSIEDLRLLHKILPCMDNLFILATVYGEYIYKVVYDALFLDVDYAYAYRTEMRSKKGIKPMRYSIASERRGITGYAYDEWVDTASFINNKAYNGILRHIKNFVSFFIGDIDVTDYQLMNYYIHLSYFDNDLFNYDKGVVFSNKSMTLKALSLIYAYELEACRISHEADKFLPVFGNCVISRRSKNYNLYSLDRFILYYEVQTYTDILKKAKENNEKPVHCVKSRVYENRRAVYKSGDFYVEVDVGDMEIDGKLFIVPSRYVKDTLFVVWYTKYPTSYDNCCFCIIDMSKPEPRVYKRVDDEYERYLCENVKIRGSIGMFKRQVLFS